MILHGGRSFYGFTLGVIILDTHFPRILGDVGNAKTWKFPVIYKVVEGVNAQAVIRKQQDCVEKILICAKELEMAGARVITTSCGFLSLLQETLARSVKVPVITSALLLIPLVYRICGMKPVGIITADAKALTNEHLLSAGAAGIPVRIAGLEDTHFGTALLMDKLCIDYNEARNEVVHVAKMLVQKHPEIGCIVLECANLPPFAVEIENETGLVVFDLVDLVNMVCYASEKATDFSQAGPSKLQGVKPCTL